MSTAHSLKWLDRVLDQCRDLIARGRGARSWTKPSTRGDRTELVTELDVAVDAVLTQAIHAHAPDAAILSEESNADPSALAAETCFVIDPIDGTDELAAGRPGYAIAIALFDHGRPVAALLDQPAHDRRFDGVLGAGARLNGKAVVLSQVTSLDQARLAVSATQLGTESLKPFWDTISAASLQPTPAFAAKVAAVLAGDCDAALYLAVSPHPAFIWDYAAPALLLAEAGGWFGTTAGAYLLDARPYVYSGGWIATPTALRDQLLAVIELA